MTTETIIGKTTFRAGKVAIIASAHGIHDVYQAFLPTLLPVLIKNFSLIKTEAGLLSVFMNLPSILQPFIGYLADRASLKRFVILAPAVTAILMSSLGLATSYWMAVLILVVVGLSSASIHATGPVIAGRLSGERLGLGMSFWMVGGEIGRTLGPIIIVMAIRFLQPEGVPWLAVVGVLTSILLYSLLKDVHPQAVGGLPSMHWKEAVKVMRPVLIPVIGITITRAFIFSSASTYLPTFLTDEGSELMKAGIWLSIYQAAGVVGALTSGPLSDRLGRRPLLTFSLLGSALCMVGFLSVEGWLQIPFLMALGFSLISNAPVIMAAIQESFPSNRALANGIYMAVSFVSSSIATLMVGAAGDLFSLRTAYFISAILVLLGLPFIRMLPAANGKTLEPGP